ncbi:hypothetical protein [Planobispora rosea]|uniref:hypothetical protein n=1 Tax=Planobispora rosea TaxID=35762 RepID=UPI00083A956A|nr:hypothetical protein [Planobispora rosea]
MNEFAEFLTRREDWLKVIVTENRFGNYDIAIVIDGGYGAEDAARNAVDYERRLRDALRQTRIRPASEDVA